MAVFRQGDFYVILPLFHIYCNEGYLLNGGCNYMICVSAKKSMTHAVKAKRVLQTSGIRCEIVNLDGSVTKRGCAYGVSFPCEMTDRVQAILKKYDLDYGEIIG